MNKERWEYIKALRPPAPRMFHVSKYFFNKEKVGTDGVVTKVQRASVGNTYTKPVKKDNHEESHQQAL